MDVRGKNIIVIGASKSGIAASKLLLKNGGTVSLFDSGQHSIDDEKFAELIDAGAKLIFGENPTEEAIDGSDLIVLSPGVPMEIPPLLYAKSKGKEIIGEIELGYRFMPKASVIAITGTNGKTTTTTLVGEIIKLYKKDTVVAGNIGFPFTESISSNVQTSVFVLELSSFQLESNATFKPDIACVLNITPDHLNRHKTMENYIESKEKIFQNCNENSFIVLNYDDVNVKKMSDKISGRVIYFSLRNKLQEGVYIENNNIVIKDSSNLVEILSIDELPIPGEHNVENIMAAIAISFYFGVPVNIIKKGIIAFKGVSHRIELVGEFNGITFYNDSKGTNPDASVRAINAMSRPIVLIGGGYKKDSDFTEYTNAFKNKVKSFIAVGETADDILNSAEKSGFVNNIKTNTFKEAVITAIKQAEDGDCVLLSPACASWDMFDNFEQRGDFFKEIVWNYFS